MATLGAGTMKTKATLAQKRNPEQSAPTEGVVITGVLICMPIETVESPFAEPDTIGVPIMPQGFVIDTGFLPTAARMWR